jgi:hypothetical protein
MPSVLSKNNKFDTIKLISPVDVIDQNIASLSINGGVYIEKGIRIGYTNSMIPGLLRFNGTHFQGYDGNTWITFSSNNPNSIYDIYNPNNIQNSYENDENNINNVNNINNANMVRYNYFGDIDENIIMMVENGINPSDIYRNNNKWYSGNIFMMLVKNDIRINTNDILNNILTNHVIVYNGTDWHDMGSII